MTKIIEVDNLDSKTTTLHLQPLSINVDPQDLMMNMIENLPEPLNDKYEALFLKLITDLDKDLEELT